MIDSSPVGRLRYELETPLHHIVEFSEILTKRALEQGGDQCVTELRQITTAAENLRLLIEEKLRPDALRRLARETELALPAAAPSPPIAATRPAHETTASRTNHGGYLLIVDDNPANREMLAWWLQEEGYTVKTADGGRQALKMIEEREPDLILLDIQMPDMSGLEVLKIVRVEHTVVDLPVIMVTGMDRSEDVVLLLKSGANDYVTKPIDFSVLQARIETHLAVKQLSELKDDFMAIASHDLKSPLTVVLGYSQALRRITPREESLVPMFHEMVDSLCERASTMKRMVEDFLDFQVLKDGGIQLHAVPINMNEVAQRTADAQRGYASEKKVTLDLVLAQELPLAAADPSRIGQVMDNLVNNAIKFSRPDTHVSIQTMNNEHGVEVFVQDGGPGLSPDDMSRLFVKYARLSNRPTGGETSTGLGLAICKQIVELHGGAIGARNNADVGSTFFFRLPRVGEPAATENAH